MGREGLPYLGDGGHCGGMSPTKGLIGERDELDPLCPAGFTPLAHFPVKCKGVGCTWLLTSLLEEGILKGGHNCDIEGTVTYVLSTP